MAQDKISMPTSTAGITRYSNESASKFKIRPHYVVVLVVVILMIVFILHQYGAGWLGLPPLQ